MIQWIALGVGEDTRDELFKSRSEFPEEALTDNKNAMQQLYSKSLFCETETETDQNPLLEPSTSTYSET